MDRQVIDDFVGFVPVGPKPYLDRFTGEYQLGVAELGGKVRSRRARFWIDGAVYDVEYLVHKSLLRSHGEFRCAGDGEALEFCQEVANRMVAMFHITREQAVAAVNWQWADGDPTDRAPRVWIVGLDLVYHETPQYWAEHIHHRRSP